MPLNRATEGRERWRSRGGFVFAAVGLGNLWRFSYVAGENGGAAFLLVYVLFVLVIGFPLLLAELGVGRAAERESAAAFERLAPEQPWGSIGRLGVLIALIILSYYAVIAGWALRYFAVYALGAAQGLDGEGFEAQFRTFITHPVEPILWQFAIIAITIAVVSGGVERGIEAVNKLLMPALAVILLALAAHSFVLPSLHDGLGFLFRPDWEALVRPKVYLAALGQAFFSIGLAMGVMVTYGSYVPRGQRLPGPAFTIAIGDTLLAIVAGIVIFPGVFSYGMDPAQGPVLAFVVLPEIFSRMAGGTLIAVAFFLLLSIAAVTSAVSLLEVPVAYAMHRFGWRRGTASLGIGLGIFAIGIPASLGYAASLILPRRSRATH